MKSNFKHQIILLACMFALCSCDSVKDKLTVNVDVGSFTIALDDIEVDDDGVKSAIVRLAEEVAYNSFSASQVLSVAMLNLSTNIEDYQSRIEKVEIGSASITVASTDKNGKVVKDFLMDATGIQNFSVAHYELNTSHSEGVKEFAEELLKKLFAGSAVPLTVSGKTDVVSGEKLKVTITLNEVVIKAKALKD